MKKNMMALLATLALACLVLVGCGGAEGGVDDKAGFVGTWKLTGLVENGEAMSADDLKTLEDLGLSVTLDLKEDGTGTLSLFDDPTEGTWTVTDAETGTFTTEEQGDAPMKLADGVLTMEEEDTSLTFTQGGATDAAASGATAEAEVTGAADEGADVPEDGSEGEVADSTTE